MYAVLGEIEFEPLTGFTSLEERLGADYAEHALIGRKPRLQFVGDKLDEVRGSLRFHHSFCDPGAELTRLEQEKNKHEPMALVMGNGDHRGHFVITELTIVGKQHSPTGQEMAVEAELTLKQADDTPRKRKSAGFAAAGLFSSLLERTPSSSNKLAKVVSGAKTALSVAKKTVDSVTTVKNMLNTNPTLALAHIPTALGEIDISLPILTESGQALTSHAAVAAEVATEAMAVAQGIRGVAKEGQTLRDMLAATTIDNAQDQIELIERSATSMMARANTLSAPLAVMAVNSVVRRVS